MLQVEDERVLTLLEHERLLGLAKLLVYAKASGLKEVSSVSIEPTCRAACDHVINKSYELFAFVPRYINYYVSLRKAGDGSGMFGFGGQRHLDGQWVKVNVPGQIALIAGSVGQYDRQHLEVIDKIANSFASVPLSTQNNQVQPN